MKLQTYIALFRGINVGGRNTLPMKDLKTLLEQAGCVDVRTYIQSGNVVLRSSVSNAARLAAQCRAAIAKSRGFEPQVMLLPSRELERAVDDNPFSSQAGSDPKSVHLFFLAARPASPDLKSLEAIKARTEGFALKGQVFYFCAPEGFGRSRLAARVERALGVEATARNWRTVVTLCEMAKSLPAPATSESLTGV